MAYTNVLSSGVVDASATMLSVGTGYMTWFNMWTTPFEASLSGNITLRPVAKTP